MNKNTPENHKLTSNLRVGLVTDMNSISTKDSKPLHLAAEHGHHTTVETLLENGADINARNFSGQTPLHLAAKHGHHTIVKTLLENGADIKARNFSGQTPLHTACDFFKENLQTVRLLLDKGADINAQTQDTCQTPLYIAVTQRHKNLVKLFLKKNADTTVPTTYYYSYGFTPLDNATKYYRGAEIIEPLVYIKAFNDKMRFFDRHETTDITYEEKLSIGKEFYNQCILQGSNQTLQNNKDTKTLFSYNKAAYLAGLKSLRWKNSLIYKFFKSLWNIASKPFSAFKSESITPNQPTLPESGKLGRRTVVAREEIIKPDSEDHTAEQENNPPVLFSLNLCQPPFNALKRFFRQ